MIGAGDLRERVHLQRRTFADDGFGNTVAGDFETVFTCAAHYKPLRGTEAVQAQRLAGQQPYVVTIRQSSQSRNVLTDWQMVDARNPARVMSIAAISDPDGRRAWLEILATEGEAT